MKNREDEYAGCMISMVGVLICLLLIVLASGCKTVKTVVEYRELQVHDTITQVDSVWHDRWHTEVMRGDTVFIHDSVIDWKYKTKEKVVEVVKVDSVPYPVEVEKPVRYVPEYYHFTSWALWILVVILSGAVGIWLYRKIR